MTHVLALGALLLPLLSLGCTETEPEGGAGAGGQAAGGDSGSGGSFGACEVDSDCVAVADTNNPCYSAGCTLPVAASIEAAAADECVVPWEAGGPAQPSGCGDEVTDPICTLACAVMPECVLPACEDGECLLYIEQERAGESSTCAMGGAPG